MFSPSALSAKTETLANARRRRGARIPGETPRLGFVSSDVFQGSPLFGGSSSIVASFLFHHFVCSVSAGCSSRWTTPCTELESPITSFSIFSDNFELIFSALDAALETVTFGICDEFEMNLR